MGASAPSDPDAIATHDTTLVPFDHPLGCRINARGGGGKTTLARAIAQKRGLPFIELDALNHLPEWQERDAALFGSGF